MLLKTPSGYVQQSPWLSVSNKQLELMGRFMAELGLSPASRSRVVAFAQVTAEPVRKIELVCVYTGADGLEYEKPMNSDGPAVLRDTSVPAERQIFLDGDL